MTVAATAFVCRDLRLRQFRNFADLTLRFPDAGAAVVGDNGSGKTNLLEAIHYLEIFRSFRGASDEQLVRFGGDAFHIRGVFENPATGRSTEITAAFEAKTKRKRVTVDGVEPDKLGDAIGRVGIVVFSPSDMSLIAGPPGERRRFLDIVLSLARHGYLHALQRYRQVLRHRNALLKRGATPAMLGPWDEALVEWGSKVVVLRAEWIDAHRMGFARRYREIGARGAAAVEYRPGLPLADRKAADEDDVAAAFTAELRRIAARERDRAMTLAGPHRDDMGFTLDGEAGSIDLREFGSGGQMRTAAIALRMVEAETLRAAKGIPPMILLDDVFAELDPGRSRRILAMLDAEPRGQVILTAPKESDVELRSAGGFISSLAAWRIEAGRVQA